MEILKTLSNIWKENDSSFLIYGDKEVKFSEIKKINFNYINKINQGDVVALIGDYNPVSIMFLLKLIELKCIIVPLTVETKKQHQFFFDIALVDVVIDNGSIFRIKHNKKNDKIEKIRKMNHSGLIAFSSGTTGKPKAILHDLTLFLKKFLIPRKSLRSINFLLFDHVGGLNTMFHTLFNKGTIIVPEGRKVDQILYACEKYKAEVLPTTPTFLRMLLMSGYVPKKIPKELKIITYGTERMDQFTLTELCNLLPNVDFRQTYGVSELGVLRVKSEKRNSLYMKIGGEGIDIRNNKSILEIRTETAMVGYLNAPSPFDKDGWYSTKDIIEEKEGFIKIVGRDSNIINVSGLKFMASEVEEIAVTFKGVVLTKAYGKNNPITGQHCEIIVQPENINSFDLNSFKQHLKKNLQPHMEPKRIIIGEVNVGHRFKKV